MTIVRLAVQGTSDEAKHLQNTDLKPGLLVSYFFYQKTKFSIQNKISYSDWVMDSGAFSAFTKNEYIDLNDYIALCKELKKTDPTLTEIFALDVIGDPKASLKNCEKMWSEGVEAIPCFHMGSDFSELKHIAKNYPKIALGGCARIKGNKKLDWSRHCLKMVWPVKAHGFGFGSESLIMQVPFHSVDSTSWVLGARGFGRYLSLGVNGFPVRSNHHIEIEVAHYLKMQNRAQVRWKKEMALLDSL